MRKKLTMQKYPDLEDFNKKILTTLDSKKLIARWKRENQKIIFTNGCFDIFHYGHLHILYQSKRLGDKLIVGLNDDESIRSIKGIQRPIHNQKQRSAILSAISFVDLIIIFSEKTPIKLIKTIKPCVITKGSDYKVSEVVGGDEVINWGGRVTLITLIKDLSSTRILKEI